MFITLSINIVVNRGTFVQIARNRGLTPHKAKKHQRHSRVQRRYSYNKLAAKRRSQVPDVRRELQRYGGEARGIKANLVKSIKLKA